MKLQEIPAVWLRGGIKHMIRVILCLGALLALSAASFGQAKNVPKPVEDPPRIITFRGTVESVGPGKSFKLATIKMIYTVKAANARVREAGKKSKFEAIKSGKRAVVVGTIAGGTDITAQTIAISEGGARIVPLQRPGVQRGGGP